MTQAAVHAIQKQLAALSTPPISYVKDYSTEGEKKTQEEEKVEAAVEGKGKETQLLRGSLVSLMFLRKEK